MNLQGHYHVDVFDADGRFVRGVTLQQVRGTPHYKVFDDLGLLGPPNRELTEPLPLAEALRVALVQMKKHIRGPITPVLGSAPFDMLGYEWPGFFGACDEIGDDGRPRPGKRRPRFWRGHREKVLVTIEERGIGIYSSPRGAWRASFALSRRARRSLTDPSVAKPLTQVRERSPTWLRDLEFAFDLLFAVLESAPGAAKVESVRFENPANGAVFVETDLVPRSGDQAQACAEAVLGNKVEGGKLIVGRRGLRFRCDCLARVDLWMELPGDGEWLSPSALRELAEPIAARHGVPLAP